MKLEFFQRKFWTASRQVSAPWHPAALAVLLVHSCFCMGSWARQHQISGEYWWNGWNGWPAPQSIIHFQYWSGLLDATGRAEQETCSQGPLGWGKEESGFIERVSLLTLGSFVILGQIYSNHIWCPACNLCFSLSHCKRPSYDLLCWICLSGPKTSRDYCPLGNLPLCCVVRTKTSQGHLPSIQLKWRNDNH